MKDFFELTSSRSKIHKYYDDITYGEVAARFNDIKFDDYNDYETCVDMANVITHLKHGSEINNAKTENSGTLVDEINSAITNLDSKILDQGSALEIASTILKLLSKKQDSISQKEFNEMVERSLQAEKSKQEEEEEENDENQEDKEKEENNESEGNDQENQDNSENNSNGENESEEEEQEGNDGNGKGKDGDETDEESNDENSEQSGSGSKFIDRIKDKKPQQLNEHISKFVEVREIADTYQLGENGILTYEKLMKEEEDFLNKLAILESRGKLKAKKFVQKEEHDMMTEYSQITKLRNKTEMLMPTFNYKFATKNLVVKRNSYPTKQALCLMIDDSGSMNDHYKKRWVKAILYNRTVQAMKRNIELYVVAFEGRLRTIKKIKNIDDANSFYRTIGFNGGGTDVQGCATKLIEHFKKEQISVQVVIINDGQDRVDPKWEPGEEIHAIMLGHGNEQLQEVVARSNGHFEIFTS